MWFSLLGGAPGDPSACDATHDEVTRLLGRLEEYSESVNSLQRLAPNWRGEAQREFANSLFSQRSALEKTADDLRAVKRAISTYSTQLRASHSYIDVLEDQAQRLRSTLRAGDSDALTVYAQELEELRRERDVELRKLEECGRTQAAIVFEAFHCEPQGLGASGAMQKLTDVDIARISEQLKDLDITLIDQKAIGDCYFLAVLAGIVNSKDGRAFLRQQIKVHYDQNNKPDGFLVTLYDRDFFGNVSQREVLVQDVYRDGVGEHYYQEETNKYAYRPSFASVFEAAYGQISPGGTRWSVPFGGITAGRHGIAYEALTGHTSQSVYPALSGLSLKYVYTADDKARIIQAVNNGQAATAMSPLIALSDSEVETVGEAPTIIKPQHVYTVIAADSQGVTLRNPWGHNPKKENEGIFKITWETYAEHFEWTSYGDPIPPSS